MVKIVIIGAGLAGLTCAKVLHEQGIQDWILLEQQEQPGGRVQTDRVEGFRLDRGFQVLFTAYPSVQKHLNVDRLHLCRYKPGAVLVDGGHHYLLGDPFRDPVAWIPSLLNPWIPLADKLRILGLRFYLGGMDAETLAQQPEQTTADYLNHLGFSAATRQRFLDPFYRGILLDPQLDTHAHLFRFYFQMMAKGDIVTPALGMGAITRYLADLLPPHQIRFHCSVAGLQRQGERVTGVELNTGELIPAEQVVVATNSPTAKRLTGLTLPDQPRGVTCLYFSSPRPLTRGAYLHLNASGKGVINHTMELTQLSPALAPEGSHLLSVNVLGNPDQPDDDLIRQCRKELQSWFPATVTHPLTFVRLYRIPFAQFAQPIGIRGQLPRALSPIPGVILAGEFTLQSSIEGALASGEAAARTLIDNPA